MQVRTRPICHGLDTVLRGLPTTYFIAPEVRDKSNGVDRYFQKDLTAAYGGRCPNSRETPELQLLRTSWAQIVKAVRCLNGMGSSSLSATRHPRALSLFWECRPFSRGKGGETTEAPTAYFTCTGARSRHWEQGNCGYGVSILSVYKLCSQEWDNYMARALRDA